MTKNEVMAQLEKMGSEKTRKTYLNQGGKEPLFGVKVADMKTIVKKVKKDYELAKDLYDTGNGDAMYLACLLADEKKMTKADLEKWAKNATWYWHSEYSVPWVTAESAHGWELAVKWIDSTNEKIASSGWGTLASIVGITPNEKLDINALDKLIARLTKDIHSAPNRVKVAMNMFLVAVGSSVTGLTDCALAAAKKIGAVEVDMGGTACKIPAAADYIMKVKNAGKLGKKRKMARC
jgi:3-methyladenine DNA glycosylase AlkD